MLTNPLEKKGWSPVSNNNSGLSRRPSDMGEQVPEGEKQPRGQTWAASGELFWKQQKDMVRGGAQGLARRPPEPCQSRPPQAGGRRVGAGLALQDGVPPERRIPLCPIPSLFKSATIFFLLQ